MKSERSMTESAVKHTPLPWTAGLDLPLVDNNEPDPRIIWHGSMAIGSMKSVWISKEEQEANARLIIRATARDAAFEGMREALRKIAVNYGGCHCDHTTADCCENPNVGEFCPHCIAEIALANAAIAAGEVNV